MHDRHMLKYASLSLEVVEEDDAIWGVIVGRGQSVISHSSVFKMICKYGPAYTVIKHTGASNYLHGPFIVDLSYCHFLKYIHWLAQTWHNKQWDQKYVDD